MRSAGKVLLALVLVCGLTATVQAQNLDAWFNFVGGDGVAVDGGPGKALSIEKDVADGRYEFTVRLMVNNNGTSALSGHASDFWLGATNATVTTKDVTTLQGWSVQALDGINGADPIQGNDPAKLVSNIGEAGITIFNDVLVAPGAQDVGLVEWTFSIEKSGGQVGDVTDIHFGIGRSLWAVTPPNAGQLLAVGPNGPIATNNQAVSALPVISIVNVPEPATLALLGFGALALIRRRR